MPELPDVESFRRTLSTHGLGKRIDRVRVTDSGALRGTSAQALGRALKGRRFDEPERHGKWLLARTDGPTVVLHFGMTGELHWCPHGTERHRHDRVVFELSEGEIRYRDMRKLQGLRLAKEEAGLREILAGDGPDALDLGRDGLRKLLEGSRRQLKPLLMDQSRVAGLGNLLVDEILWQARLHPSRKAGDMDDAEVRRLHTEMRRVLRDSIRSGRVPDRPSWLTGSRDDLPAPCPRCGTDLAHERRGGRSTVLCPHCQPEP